MKQLTNNQLLHRQYIQSDGWKKKRLEAIEFYGQKCGRCGEFGNDVHHKTYKRMGDERISDLEVLCRECHESHHLAERTASRAGKKKKFKGIHIKALWAYLSDPQKRRLQKMTQDDLYSLIMRDDNEGWKIRKAAIKMLGMDYWYGFNDKKSTTTARRRMVHY